ncbi:MAG: hypothetical protein IJD52_00905 [Alphaproteobacteria bacterium]|nr:hypothetical protein [Alphaproteobacteria bacterium]
MSRTLQIRRGTSAEHANFTGLSGEITFDTDAKTLRVHDGETLGGFALMRKDDAATNTGGFDIESVSDEFWAQKIPQFANARNSMYETDAIPVSSSVSYIEYIAEISNSPITVQAFLICQNSDAGYAVGDIVTAFGIGNRANPQPNIFIDGDGMHICQMVGRESFWVSHKNTGQTTNVADENWAIKFRVYY